MYKPRLRFAMLAVITLVGLTAKVRACSWAEDFFYEVPVLRGKVVGTDITLFREFRWLRQAFLRPHMTLTLYVYAHRTQDSGMILVKRVVTDRSGGFDFGIIPPGHYILSVADKDLDRGDHFNIEVNNAYRPHQSVVIDISPNFPDCSGGHEVIVN